MLPEWMRNRIAWNAPDAASGGSGEAATPSDATAVTGGDTAGEDGQAAAPPGSALRREPANPDGTDSESKTAEKEGDDAPTEGTDDTVPEDGNYTYDLPEGITADETVTAAMNPVFKEAGLTQKQVSTVVSAYAELVQKDQEARAGKVNDTLTGWLEAAKADKDIGGDNWDATIQKANSVLNRFGDDEIDAALETTGAGVHPSVIRLLSRIGAAIADDSFVAGQSVTGEHDPTSRYAQTTPAGKKG